MKNAGKAILTALGWFVFSISLILVIVAIASDNTVVTVFLIIVCIFVCPLTYKILLKTPKSDSNANMPQKEINSNVVVPSVQSEKVIVPTKATPDVTTNIYRNNNEVSVPEPKVYLSPDDISFYEATQIYFATDHYSCPSKYDYNTYFKSAFKCLLNKIPEHKIELSNEKVLRNKEIDNPIDENCKRITKSNKIEKLKNFIVIDTETTGLKTGGNDIIEICAIKFIDFKPVEKFHTYLKPRKPITSEITEINHITNEMVENAPTFSQIKNDLQNYIKGYPLVAHNAPFDMRFLHVSGLDLTEHTNIVFDTLKLSKEKIRDYENNKLDSYSLESVCEEQHIVFSDAHSADSDALACGILFVDIIKKVFEVEDIFDLLIDM